LLYKCKRSQNTVTSTLVAEIVNNLNHNNQNNTVNVKEIKFMNNSFYISALDREAEDSAEISEASSNNA
jgi:hypothetical protein